MLNELDLGSEQQNRIITSVKGNPTDGEVVLAAVTVYPAALEYASEMLRGSKEFLLGAAKAITDSNNGMLVKHMVTELLAQSSLEETDKKDISSAILGTDLPPDRVFKRGAKLAPFVELRTALVNDTRDPSARVNMPTHYGMTLADFFRGYDSVNGL